MQCPKCKGGTLAPATVGGVTVDRCPQCAGIWFDARELPRVLRLDSAEVRPLRGGRPNAARDEHAGNCPRDGVRMTRVHSATNAEVVLDTCLDCQGIWLDGGEFDALRR